jgi:tetratricopeptide (TPR) repeat protein
MPSDKISKKPETFGSDEQLGYLFQMGLKIFGAAAGAAGLLYAIGFLIVNIYLLSYGVYEVALLRERYVSAGAAFLLLLVVICIAWLFFIPKILAKLNGLLLAKESKFRYKLLATFGFSVLALIIICVLVTFLITFIWKISMDPGEWLQVATDIMDVRIRSQWVTNYRASIPVLFWCGLVSIIFAPWLIYRHRDEILLNTETTKAQDDSKGSQELQFEDEDAEQPGMKERWGMLRYLNALASYVFLPWRWMISLIAVLKRSDRTEPENDSNDGGEPKEEVEDNQEESADKKDEPKFIGDLKRNWQYILVVFLVIFFLLVVYARNVFPVLPAAMGGGLPSVIQFSVKNPEDLDEFIHLGIQADETKPKMTRQITLIAQTSTNYIVLVSNPELKQEVAVSIPKEHIDSIIYYPEEYFINDEYVAEKKTQEGRDLLVLEDYESAVIKFQEAIDRIEDYIPAKIGMGDANIAMYIAVEFQNHSYLEKAINYYEEALFTKGESVLLREQTPEGKAEIFYKLARAYALSASDKKGFDLIYQCDESKELDDSAIFHPDEVAIEMLICANVQDKNTENPVGYIELAKYDRAFHQNRANIRMMERFLELLYGSKEDGFHGYRQEANRLRGEGKYEEALEWYTLVIDLVKDENLGLEVPDEDQALLYYNKAIVYLALSDQKSVLCDKVKCLGEAINNFEESIGLDPNDPLYSTKLADTYRLDSHLDKAVKIYEQITGLATTDFSNYAPAWQGLGDTYILLENYLQAREAFSRTIELQPDNADAYYGRALSGSRITEDQNLKRVEMDLRQAIGLNATLLETALEEDAFSQFDIIDDFLSATQLFQDGQSLQGEGNLEEAIEKYAEAIQRDPVNAQYHAQIAKAYIELPTPRWRDAQDELVIALSISVENDNYHFTLGKVYAVQGEYDKAIQEYQTATQLNPESASYFSVLGDALVKVDRLEDALIAQETATELKPEIFEYLFKLAEIYRLLDRVAEAEREYRNVIGANSEYWDAYCGLAIIYYQTNQVEKAAEEYIVCRENSKNTALIDLALEKAEVYQDRSEESSGE